MIDAVCGVLECCLKGAEKVCSGTVSCDIDCRICEIKESCGLCESSGSVNCCGCFDWTQSQGLLSSRESVSVAGNGYSSFQEVGPDGVKAGESLTCCGKVSQWACNNFCCFFSCCGPQKEEMK